MTSHPRITRDRSWVSALAEALSVPVADDNAAAPLETAPPSDSAVPPCDGALGAPSKTFQAASRADHGPVAPVR